MDTFEQVFSESERVAIKNEFQRLKDNIYLDHAGTTLYSEKQIDNAAKVLKENLFCNPHTCKITGDLVDQVRYRILEHFNTDATQYDVVFTANATAAFKLVAETFKFSNNDDNNKQEVGNLYLCQENHTSALGMRKIVKTNNHYVLTKDELLQSLNQSKKNESSDRTKVNSLLVFSAQCNFSGYKMPLDLIENIHNKGLLCKGTKIKGDNVVQPYNEEFYIFLDTASFVSTNFLNLNRYKPDFCCISFYKMFGYPTGVGALLVSKRGQEVLNKIYYGGGTVKIAMTREDFHVKRDYFTEKFEDGTLPFLAIASLLEGFRTIERLVPPTQKLRTPERISRHVFGLAKHCHNTLSKLTHLNGSPLIKFYNHEGFENVERQGGIVTFNILHDSGTFVGFAEVACIAAVFNINLRTGCFCNPGACQWFLSLSNDDIKSHFNAGHICSDYNDLVDGVPTGAVRLSFGYMTTFEDVEKCLKVIKDCYQTTAVERLSLLETKNLPRQLKDIPKRLKPHLKSIYIYPIKSCGAFQIKKAWPLNETGLKYDRCWMIVDNNNMVITQKHDTRLCLIQPHINTEEGYLELNFPKMEAIKIPLDIESMEESDLTRSSLCQSKICSDLVEGNDCGDAVAKWLSDCLDMSVRLVRHNADRRTNNGEKKDIGLANQAQFLLINQTSVRWLASKVLSESEPFENTIDRFRANFIIETSEPLDENNYEEITIGKIRLKVDGFCTRCQMICIDQHSGQKTAEPLKTIARELKGKIRFGIYLSLDPETKNDSSIWTSDDLTVVRKNGTVS